MVDTSLQEKVGDDKDVIAYIRQLLGHVQAVYDTMALPRFHFRIADIHLCKVNTAPVMQRLYFDLNRYLCSLLLVKDSLRK